jgi:hypothetical protein
LTALEVADLARTGDRDEIARQQLLEIDVGRRGLQVRVPARMHRDQVGRLPERHVDRLPAVADLPQMVGKRLRA